MKKLFSTPRFLHGFYGSVIVLLVGYIYTLSVSFDAYKRIGKTMDADLEITNAYAKNVSRDFEQYSRAYLTPMSERAMERLYKIRTETDTAIGKVNTAISELEASMNNHHWLLTQTSMPTQFFFSDKKMMEHEAFLQKHYKSVFEKIVDTKDRAILQKEFDKQIDKKTEQKLSSLPYNVALLMLKKQRLDIAKLYLSLANYFNAKYTGCGGKIDDYMVGISPNMGVVKVGEEFSADVVLVQYVSQFEKKYIDFWVNGKTIETNNGVGHYRKIYSTPGRKTIRVEASLKNPLTEQVESRTKEYSFEVLPK
jgi:hypothetical protein